MTKISKISNCTIFEYAYIDGSNYKAFGEVWLSGNISGDQHNAIVDKLDSGQFFVAEQIGIPPLYDDLFTYSNGVTADDHGWHVFIGFRNELKLSASIESFVWGSVEQLLTAFRSIVEWQPSLSKNYYACEAVMIGPSQTRY